MRALFSPLLAACLAIALLAAGALPAAAASKNRGPEWASLNADQQQVLAPLSSEWNKLPPERKRKWLGIAKRYPDMKPTEQKRVQARMQRWAKLTPDQRWQARERYRSLGKLAAERRKELHRYWAAYQSLPAHEKRMFDVPPTYVRPAERRHRPAPVKKKSAPPYVTPPSPH